MLFNSYEFIFLFLPITFFVYFYLNSVRLTEAAKGFLVFSSLLFYSWWNVVYLPLILSSMLFNYVVGNMLSRHGGVGRVSKKTVLIFGICSNVLLLGYFKYSDFFITNVNNAFDQNIDLLNLALPLAISFFTFQQIAYLVDSYRKETKEYDFLNYAVFVTFFPQLIAGPIVHHKEMMPQFANLRNSIINYRNIALGLFVFSLGLFKKVVIADKFSIWASNGFDVSESLNLFSAWATSLSYTFQIYFDFSGYTDMAIGLALLFNIKLPVNFNSPYKAINIQDFWRRWHITLSRFLRDYVYIPLGGNREKAFRTYNNLMITFIVGGIWHGAGWTFLLWGFLHGLALIVHRIWRIYGFGLWAWVSWLITFNFINLTWVFFRAKEWNDAIKVLSGMFGLDGVMLPEKYMEKLSYLSQYGVEFGRVFEVIDGKNSTITLLVLSFVLVLMFKNSIERLDNFSFSYKDCLFSGVVFSWAILSLTKVSEFLYFNF